MYDVHLLTKKRDLGVKFEVYKKNAVVAYDINIESYEAFGTAEGILC